MTTIGLIGAGNIGGTLARLFARAGHDVIVANSRGPETLTGLVEEIGEQARAGTAAEAARAGDVLVVSIPFGRYRKVPVEGTDGTIVIDTTNYYPRRDGQVPQLDDDATTSSELVAAHLSGARVVKAFNAIQSQRLGSEGRPAGAGRTAVPIAGDDEEAKAVVHRLVDEIGFDAVDTGGLATSRLFQPGAALYGVPVTAADIRGTMA